MGITEVSIGARTSRATGQTLHAKKWCCVAVGTFQKGSVLVFD